MQSSPMHASCLSLVSAVGLTPESACAAMRAGLVRIGETSFKDNRADPIVGAVVPGLGPRVRGRQRIVELLCCVLAGLPQRLPSGLRPGSVPLLFCTREVDCPGADLGGVLAEAEARLNLGLRVADASEFADGTVAAFKAMAHARRLFTRGAAQAALIVAVDSLMDTRTLHWLDEHKRLKKDENPDGVIPGEAACVTLVTSCPLFSAAPCVAGLGFGHETATVLNEEPLLGKGMAGAVRDALAEAGLRMHEVAFRLSDVAGESYGFEELALAQIRNTTIPRSSQSLLHPASSIGDCGAANGLLQLAWAEQAMRRRYARGPVALAHASAHTGSRAAAVLLDPQWRS